MRIRVRQRRRGREQAVRLPRPRALVGSKRFAMRRDEASRQRAGSRHRDLLAEQRADGQLEAVPRARYPHSGALPHAAGQATIAREMRFDGGDVDVQIEEAAQASHDRRQRRHVAGVDGGQQMAPPVGRGLHLDDSPRRADREGPLVALALDALDPRHGARREELDHRPPLVGRGERQLEANARGPGDALGRGGLAQRARRSPVGLPQGVVEPAHAPEARPERDLRHRERRLAEEFLGEEDAMRLRDGDGRRADVAVEEPPELPVADAQAPRQLVDSVVAEAALGDEVQGAGDRSRRSIPAGEPRRHLGPTPQARAKAQLVRRGGARQEDAVLELRDGRRADGAAVDAGAHHGRVEAPVEARVARAEGAIAGVAVQIDQGHRGARTPRASRPRGAAATVFAPDLHRSPSGSRRPR